MDLGYPLWYRLTKGIFMKDSTSLRFKSITAICFGSLMMFSATTEASSFHIEMSQCDVSMQGTLGIENGVMTVTTEQRQALTIDAEQNVKIDGTKLALTASEKALAEQYYYNINAAVPMGIEIAAQGLELSNVAINDILSPLLGEDDEMIIKLNELLVVSLKDYKTIYDPQGNLSIAPNMNGANWFTQNGNRTLNEYYLTQWSRIWDASCWRLGLSCYLVRVTLV